MATKKDICLDCVKYNHATQLCQEEQLKEVIILHRQETVVNYRPYKQTKCDYYKGMGEE